MDYFRNERELAKFFNEFFYSQKYPDVLGDSSAKLKHFLEHGIYEGRSPHPLIDIDFYRSSHPEISHNWLVHYLDEGWKLGWSCSPLINFASFRAMNSDWVNSGVSPLEYLLQQLDNGIHIQTGALSTELIESRINDKPIEILNRYVLQGLGVPVSGNTSLLDHLPEMDLSPSNDVDARIEYWSRQVSIVMPLHSDHAVTRTMLNNLSVYVKTLGIDVVLILDGCPDEVFAVYIRDLVNEGFKVHENITSLGFSASVNLGVSLTTPSNHVLILNADVVADLEVFAHMLDALESDPKLASVTSLSNYGSIASYPIFGRETHWLPVAVSKMTHAFSTNSGSNLITYVPTCVGHCVLLRRKAWNMLAWFDAANFPQGYGEEVDWSIRASTEGWRHAIANRAFVWHQGSTSFGDRKPALKEAGEKALKKIHGDYFLGFQESLKSSRAQLLELFQSVECQVIAQEGIFDHAIIVHCFGGGTYEFIDRQNSLTDSTLLIFVEANSNTFRLALGRHFFPNLVNKQFQMSELPFLINQMKIPRIDLHTGVSFNSYALFMKLRALEAEITIYLHDFSPFCGRINLVGGESDEPKFCGGGTTAAICQICIEKHGSNIGEVQIEGLRHLVAQVFRRASKVIVPSKSAQKLWKKWEVTTSVFTHPASHEKCLVQVEDRLREAYLTDENFNVRFVDKPELQTSSFRVLVPGRISVAKGATLIQKVLRLNRTLGTPIEFILCGDIDRTIIQSPTGFSLEINDYQGALPKVCNELNVNVVWLSSIWPETHLYVLDDIGVLPTSTTIVLNEYLGAPRERLASFGFDDVLCVAPNPEEIMKTLLRVKARTSELLFEENFSN